MQHNIGKLGLLAVVILMTTACGLLDQQEPEPMPSDRELALLADCREAGDVAQMTQKFAVCHSPASDTREPYTMLLSRQARDFHLAHGDASGGCGCDEVDDESSSPAAVESGFDTTEGDGGEVTDYCDANQYRCKHNWGCPDSHVCDLGCCVYVISWADSVDRGIGDDESDTESDVDGTR